MLISMYQKTSLKQEFLAVVDMYRRYFESIWDREICDALIPAWQSWAWQEVCG